MSDLKLARNLALPLNAVTRASSIVGQRGTGKTSTAVVFVEEAARAGAPFAIVDPTGAWYGLSSNAAGDGPGLDCVVMGGETGDVPLWPDSGPLVARLVVEEGYSVVLNLERTPRMKWSWETRKRFVAEFAEELYERNRSALSLVIDEAHRFAPQGSTQSERGGYGARCIGAVTDVVTLGRRKGLGVVLISQRPSKINKDVFEQAEILVAHRLMGSNDRKQVKGWLEEVGEASAGLGKLHTLEEQHALVYAPTMRPPIMAQVVKVREKRTFDSSATPEVDGEVVLPKKRSEIDLAALEAQMGEALERHREEDPKALQERVNDLETRNRELEAKEIDPDRLAQEYEAGFKAGNEAADQVEVPVAPPGLRHDLRVLADGVEAAIEDVRGYVGRVREQADDLPVEEGVAERVRSAAGAGQDGSDPGGQPEAEPAADAGPSTRAPSGRPGADQEQNGDRPVVKAGAKRMLIALLRYHPRRLSRREIGTLAVVKTGGTMSDYLSALRGNGFLDEEGDITLSSDGLAAARDLARQGGISTERLDPTQVYALHEPKLKAGARRMMGLLMRAREDGFTRKELGAAADVKTGGTMSDYVSALRSAGLIAEHNRRLFPSPTLYLDEEMAQR